MIKLIFILTTILSISNVYADLYVKVYKVVDGDTVRVVDEKGVRYKIRLVGIDAPEKKQPYGDESTKHLRGLVNGKWVTIISPTKSGLPYTIDRYQRVLGKIIIHNEDINYLQLLSGMAWHYKRYQKDQSIADQLSYSLAEQEAQSKELGLWGSEDSIAPWKWRRKNK